MRNYKAIPPDMLSARRWMITTKTEKNREIVKRPRAPFDQKPDDWPEERPDGSPVYWPSSWDIPQAWGTFEQARSYLDRHTYGDNLSFVTHPGGDGTEIVTRWVCIDIDKAYDTEGNMLDEVERFLASLPDTYVESSASGKGLHVIVLVEDCPLYRTAHRQQVFGASVDILFSGQVVITGDALPFYSSPTVARFSVPDFLALFPTVDFREKQELQEFEHTWEPEEKDKVSEKWEHLRRDMEEVDCIQGENGQKSLFRAACSLARAGVPLDEVEPLLRLCNSDPPWTTKELRYIAHSAYKRCAANGELGSNNVYEEFEPIEVDPKEETPKVNRYGFVPIPANDLEAMDLELEWIVESMLVDKEPLMIGGREKSFKTSVAMDLAIAITTGSHFLGSFEVHQKRTCTFFTGEIGAPAAKKLVRRIRESKGLEQGTLDGLVIVDTVPSFTDRRQVGYLERYLKEQTPEIAVFDPLYFCMMGSEVGDMYQIGGVLRDITDICKKYNVWPWFVHHARKDSTKEYQPMELGDLYGSGVSAFARQWILTAHAESYRNGVANLFVNVGGSSTGDCGLWNLRIDEGVADEIADRRWDVKVDRGTGLSTAQLEEDLLKALETMGGEGRIKDLALAIDRPLNFTKGFLRELSGKQLITFSNGAVRLCVSEI